LCKSEEILDVIKKIINAVPSELHRFEKPNRCSPKEWDISTPEEKGFLLIKDIFLDEKELLSSPSSDIEELNVLKLGKGPTFWTQADEDMFFNCIYT
jgi:hypothetical protein